MSLVLAIEPDPRQAAILKRVVHERAHADIAVVDSKDAAIAAIGARVPELILVTALLSPRDEEELVAHLRTLDEADHLQTITIPLLATAGGAGGGDEEGGFFRKAFRRKKTESAGVGCDPWAFADQVTGYLRAANEARAARLMERAYERAHPSPISADPVEAAPVAYPAQSFEPAASSIEAAAPVSEPHVADVPATIPPATPDVAEAHGEHAAPETAEASPAEQKLTDPEYAFSWRSSKPEPAKKHKKSERKDAHRHHTPAPPVVRPAKAAPAPEPPAPKPEPVVTSAPPIPEPVVETPAPAVAASEPIAIPEPPAKPKPVVKPEPVVVKSEPVVVKSEPVVVKSEPVVVKSEPVVVKSEPVVVKPEPVVVKPGPVVVKPEPVVVKPEPVVAEARPVAPTPPPAKAAEPVTPPGVVLPFKEREPEPAATAAAKPAKPARAAKVLQALGFGKAREPETSRAPAIVLRPLKRLPALAMWARLNEEAERIGESQVAPPQVLHARHEDDDVAALIGGLRVPSHVLAVSYPRRPYIHRVRSAA